MPRTPVYLDYHATTPVDPRVVEAMLPYFTKHFGNAGSTSHAFGWEAKDAVDAARVSIAGAIDAQPREIVFTSGATESNNLALRGIAERQRRRGNHLVSVATEHKAILDPLQRLARRGFEVTLLSVDRQGLVDPQQVTDVLRDDTCLVSVMLANNEIGVIQPVAEIGRICRERGVPLHCDAAQAVGKTPVSVQELNVDLLSISAHKIYGPKGVGALYVRRESPPVRLEPQQDGGGQEGGLRSGTLNVPGTVGFATALQLCQQEMSTEIERLRELRQRLYDQLVDEIPEVTLNGPPLDQTSIRLPNNLNCTFAYVDGEALMLQMKTVAVSSGSACTSANPEPSHVLRAIGLSEDLCRASLRFGLGRFTTTEEIDFAASAIAQTVRELRKLSSLAPP